MKTPEEIKIWLNGCKDKSDCQLCYNDWVCKENAYALAYIKQLEAENSRKDDTIRNLTELLNAAHEETAKARQERDAAARDCSEFPCNTCDDRENRDLCCNCIKPGSTRRTNHVWRGICPENTEVQDDD